MIILLRQHRHEHAHRLPGLDTINACIRELGFAHTVLHNALHFDRYRQLGTTTPRDYASLLAQMARGTLVSKAASVEMLAILRQQHYNTMLTKDFPQYYLDCEETGPRSCSGWPAKAAA